MDRGFPIIRQLFQNSKVRIGIFSVPDFTLLWANQSYLDFLDEPFKRAERSIGHKIGELINEWDCSKLKAIWDSVLETGKPYSKKEFRYDRYGGDNACWDMEISPVFEDGKLLYIVEKAADAAPLTGCRKCIQHEYLSRVIDSLEIPIARIAYPTLAIMAVNSRGYDLITQIPGINTPKSESVIGSRIYDLFPFFESTISYEHISRMANSKASIYQNNIKLALNGGERYYNVLYQPVIGRDEEVEEFLVIGTDVTAEVIQRQAAEKILKTQEEFFSYIAHEFKTPLTTMSATIQFLELVYSNEMTENIRSNINVIKRNVFQQMRLVNNLLDITRAEAGYLKISNRNLDIVSVTRAITRSIDQYAKARDIKLEFSSDVGSKIIAVDDEKYERILLNLLSNAIKFTPGGKSISVSVSLRHREVLIRVKDEGAGIPENKLGVIFERFGQAGSRLTRQSEGTGLGLCLVKLLVKAMNGEIRVESVEGSGSTFIVSLPDMKVDGDETIRHNEFMDNRLIRTLNVEFSNIYSEL